MHQAHVFGRIENFFLGDIRADKRIHIGVVGFLLRGYLRIKRRLHLVVGHGHALGAQRIKMIEHALELGALIEGFIGIARRFQLGLGHLFDLILRHAIAGQILLVVFHHLSQSSNGFSLIRLVLLRRERIASIAGMALSNLLAQLHLHSLLRNGVLELGIILVHLIAVLRIVGDVSLEHLVELRLHLRHQHADFAVIGGCQHSILGHFLGHGRKAAAQHEQQRHQQGHQLLHHSRLIPSRIASRFKSGYHYTVHMTKTQ